MSQARIQPDGRPGLGLAAGGARRRPRGKEPGMETSNVQVLNRALDLLEQLTTSAEGVSISELSKRTKLPKSTIHRILNTFVARHYVRKSADNDNYELGYKFVELSSVYLNKIVLKTEAVPIMRRLAGAFNAISYLGVLENAEVMYLEKIEQHNNIRLYTQIGKREPLHCTGLGKVLLSALSPQDFESVARRLDYVRFTPTTITGYEQLREEIEQIRRDGYAVDNAEHEPDNFCVAVPIYDFTRNVMAAMSVSKNHLFVDHDKAFVVEKMKAAAEELSQHMGYTGPGTTTE